MAQRICAFYATPGIFSLIASSGNEKASFVISHLLMDPELNRPNPVWWLNLITHRAKCETEINWFCSCSCKTKMLVVCRIHASIGRLRYGADCNRWPTCVFLWTVLLGSAGPSSRYCETHIQSWSFCRGFTQIRDSDAAINTSGSLQLLFCHLNKPEQTHVWRYFAH